MTTENQQMLAQLGALHDDMTQLPAEIRMTMAGKVAEVDAYLAISSRHHPLVRLSKSQYGNLDVPNAVLNGWTKNVGVSVDVVKSFTSGTAFADRPVDEQEILTGMGHETTFFQPATIHVMRMIWAGMTVGDWTMFPGQLPMSGGWLTAASYAKIVSGQIGGSWLASASNVWGLCGLTVDGTSGAYMSAHPLVQSAAGEVHFVWAGVAAGRMEIDRVNPRWGWMPHISAQSANDLTV